MSQLTPTQVAGYVLAAGFTGHGAVKAVSVALAESGGNTAAHAVNHDRYRSTDRGLFQINSHWHPEVTDAQAYDPAQASAAAYRISHAGKDWSAWSTWTNGKAAAMTGRARLAVAQAHQLNASSSTSGSATGVGFHWWDPRDWPIIPNPLDPGLVTPNPLAGGQGPLGGVLGGAENAAKGVGQIAVLAAHAGLWMADPHNWMRVVMVVAGTGAVIVAGVLLAESGAAGSTAASVARTTTKTAKHAAEVAALA